MILKLIIKIFPKNTHRGKLLRIIYIKFKLKSNLQLRSYKKQIFPAFLIFQISSLFEKIVKSYCTMESNLVQRKWPELFIEYMSHCIIKKVNFFDLYSELHQIIPVNITYRNKTFHKLISGGKKLKILYITGMFPSFEHGGGLRLFDILMALTKKHEVDLFSCFIPDLDQKSYNIINSRFKNIKLIKYKADINISEIEDWLKEIGRNNHYYDIIQLEYPPTIGLAENVRKFGGKIGYTYMESASKSAAIEIERKINNINLNNELPELFNNFFRFAQKEKEISKKADFTIAMTDEDAQFIQMLSGCTPYVIPVCVSDYFFSKWKNYNNSLIEYDAAFIGFFDHHPNNTGILWYYENIHKKVVNNVEGYKLLIIGRGDSNVLKKRTKDDKSVAYTGPVDDIAEYIAKAKICISPLISGAGIRGKINQYAYLGKPSVSTTIGLRGTPYEHGKSVFKADDPNEFAKYMILLLKNRNIYKKMSSECRKISYKYFRWDKKIKDLESIYYK
jgi:glycosyltransferase involved in cell wall biosynthesis